MNQKNFQNSPKAKSLSKNYYYKLSLYIVNREFWHLYP